MLLNKKRGLLVLFSLFLALLIPLVSAQYEGVYSMFSFLLGTGEGGAFMFLKAGVWIVLFAIIFWLAKKMFSGSKGIATIFSIVVSLISIRFIPDEYIYYIGSAYGVFGIVVLILAIIGGTLLILNSYFPIKQHKAFAIVWALFYFFIAWIFHQLTDIITGIYQIDELLPVIGPWGKWVCIILGIICLLRSFSGTSKYAITPQPQYEPEGQGSGGGDQGGGSQQPTYVKGGEGGKGGSATANANALQAQAQMQMQKQKQKQKQSEGKYPRKPRQEALFEIYSGNIKIVNQNKTIKNSDLMNNDTTYVRVRNGGGGTLYWRANSSKALEVSPSVGSLKGKKSINLKIRLTMNRDQIKGNLLGVTIIGRGGPKNTTGNWTGMLRHSHKDTIVYQIK